MLHYSRADVCRLLAECYDTKSIVKLVWFQSQLEAACMSSHSNELWYNETVGLWMTIYTYICNILICRCMQKHIQHNKDEGTLFFRKIYFSLYLKGFERVMKGIIYERWVGDWTELQHIDPHSSGHSSISFPFSWAAQPGAWGPSLYFDIVLNPVSSLQLIWTSCHQGYIIIWHPPTSCERHICTQFNLSIVKVIPDPLISSTGCTYYLHRCISHLTARLGRRSICYIYIYIYIYIYREVQKHLRSF